MSEIEALRAALRAVVAGFDEWRSDGTMPDGRSFPGIPESLWQACVDASRLARWWTGLPPAVPRPCRDCPWRRASAPGWLGPMSPERWIATAHGEAPIACHMTIPSGSVVGSWDDPSVRQCAGAAIFRRNVAKRSIRDDAADHHVEPDPASVFASDAEFVAHHRGGKYQIWEEDDG